jgi:hypothetical protein
MLRTLLILFACVVGAAVVPILSYLIMKFGSAAYFRERQKYNKQNQEENGKHV